MPLSEAAANIERDPDLQRYSRQIMCAQMGVESQRRLTASRVTLIGCGALGSALANLLARAGVGFLRIIDRDYIELNNLQRQHLFDERDIADQLPKAEAAARRLRQVNSRINIEPIVTDAAPANIQPLCDGAHLVLDGTDNLETRYLINDCCVKHGRPWVYGACIGDTGMMMPVIPGETPCLRCIWPDPPPPGASDTCDTVGILGPVVDMAASWQAIEALKILSGQMASVQRRLLQFCAWSGRCDWFDMSAARDGAGCPCCGKRQFDFLEGRAGSKSAIMCGRNAVQVTPAPGARVSLNELAAKLAGVSATPPATNAYLMRFTIGEREFTVFADGRAMIKGTSSVEEARGLYAKYIGA